MSQANGAQWEPHDLMCLLVPIIKGEDATAAIPAHFQSQDG